MKIMVIAAHPDLQQSKANRTLLTELKTDPDIYCRNLYEEYADWQIDIAKEQQLLIDYDRIVLQFPFYWYSAPPLLKKWFDDVLTYGWAYGPGGDRLQGKQFIIATTAGGSMQQYRSGGDNQFTISEFLRPIQRTITKCNGIFLPAFVTYNAMDGSEEYLSAQAKKFIEHIRSAQELLVS